MKQEEYPLVTFFILSYNQERFIEEALIGAFSQDYPNLEILISDDYSTDKTWDIIQSKVAEYHGPHKIVLNRNEKNLGLINHVNKVFYELSNGEILVCGAGDDISMPYRTTKTVEIFEKHPDVMSLSSDDIVVDENLDDITYAWQHIRKEGYSILTLSEYILFNNFYLFGGASRSLRRKVLEEFPPLIAPDEDIYMFIRSLYVGSVAYIHEPLIKYRIHGENTTRKRIKKGGAYSIKKKRQLHKAASEAQFRQDLEIAIRKGFIEKRHVGMMEEKLSSLFDNAISPKPLNIFQRVIKKGIKYLQKLL